MKTWHSDIRAHIDRWTHECRERGNKWRPRLAYHFTDVRNAASILEADVLLSRQAAVSAGVMQNDNAAADIIAETPPPHTRYVRLYFRPRTPTQYQNEGIRPPERLYRGAHCPVPIFFCFDLFEVLSADDVEFSNGSMARPGVAYGNSSALFTSIPFDQVYHDRAFAAGDDKAKITFHRHAEILVPDRLTLHHLAGVACRSAAERATLLHLMTPTARARWTPRIHCVGDPLFYRYWNFVDSISAVDGRLHVRFNPTRDLLSRGILLHVRGTEVRTGQSWDYDARHTAATLVLEFPRRAMMEISILIDGTPAFRGNLDLGDEAPF